MVCISIVPVGKDALALVPDLVLHLWGLLYSFLRSLDKNVSSVLDETIHH